MTGSRNIRERNKRRLSPLLTLGSVSDNSSPPTPAPSTASLNSTVSFHLHQTFALAQSPHLQPPCECWGPHIVQWSLSPSLGVCAFSVRDLLPCREGGSELSCAPQILPCTCPLSWPSCGWQQTDHCEETSAGAAGGYL